MCSSMVRVGWSGQELVKEHVTPCALPKCTTGRVDRVEIVL